MTNETTSVRRHCVTDDRMKSSVNLRERDEKKYIGIVSVAGRNAKNENEIQVYRSFHQNKRLEELEPRFWERIN